MALRHKQTEKATTDILSELGMTSREEAVAFLKRLWRAEPTPCPKCGTILGYMHKKAKKSNCDWVCQQCGAVYKTIHILDRLNER